MKTEVKILRDKCCNYEEKDTIVKMKLEYLVIKSQLWEIVATTVREIKSQLWVLPPVYHR